MTHQPRDVTLPPEAGRTFHAPPADTNREDVKAVFGRFTSTPTGWIARNQD